MAAFPSGRLDERNKSNIVLFHSNKTECALNMNLSEKFEKRGARVLARLASVTQFGRFTLVVLASIVPV